jgi:SPP1 gp7 family putative phage head morphogenesis protein
MTGGKEKRGARPRDAAANWDSALLGRNVSPDVKIVTRAYPRYREDLAQVAAHPLFKREYTPEDLENAFVRDEVANKLVRKLARDCVGKWFSIDAPESLKRAIVEQLDAITARASFYRALVLMFAYGRCALMLGTEKDASIEDERVEKAQLLYLAVMHPRYIKAVNIETDPKKKEYGEVASIGIERLEGGSPMQRKVPRSRYIWLANIVAVDDPKGSSILTPIMDQLTIKKNLDWSVGESYFKNASPLHQLELPDDADQDEFDEADEKFKDISARSEFVTPAGYKIYLHGTQNVMSPAPYTQHNLKCISAGLDVPYQLVLGTGAGAVTGAEMNLKDYYQSIAVMQKLIVEPYVRELIDVLQGTGQIPAGPYQLTWNPLEEMDEKERAEIAKMGADALVSAINALPKLLKYGLKCRFVDGRLVVEDGEVVEPKEEPAPESPPELGMPAVPGLPSPEGGPRPQPLPPDAGGPPGSPHVPSEGELVEELKRDLERRGATVMTLGKGGRNQGRGLSRPERTELFERLKPDTAFLEKQAAAQLAVGLHDGVDELLAWLEKQVLKALKKVQGRDASPLDVEDPVLWKKVYAEGDLRGEIAAYEFKNLEARKVSQTVLDAGYEAGFVKSQAVLGLRGAKEVLRDERAIRWLLTRRKMFYSKIIGGTGGGEIKDVILTGLDRGWGIPKVKAALGKVLDATELRLEDIARTETMRAANEGALLGYKDNGVTESRLLVTPDETTCEECMALDGRVYPVDEASGVLPVHIKCRCVWEPVTETMQMLPAGGA